MDNSLSEKSMALSHLLDMIGHSRKTIVERRLLYQQMQRCCQTRSSGNVTILLQGQAVDGNATPFESKLKCHILPKDVVCIQPETRDFSTGNLVVLEFEREHSPSGYVRLKVLHFDGEDHIAVIRKSTFGYHQLVWSSSFVRQMNARYHSNKMLHIALNAKNYIGKIGTYYYGLRCLDVDSHTFCEHVTHRQNWPSPRQAVLVPVGSGESDGSHLEWRVCFNEAEAALMRNLNSVHLKLYRLLRFLNEVIRKQTSAKFTSYLMKNVLFFISKDSPDVDFTEDKLLHFLSAALKWIELRIAEGHLPSYFIPTRNLLSESDRQRFQRNKIMSLLRKLQTEELFGLLRCRQIQEVVRLSTRVQSSTRYIQNRDKLERLLLWLNYYLCLKGVSTNEEELTQTHRLVQKQAILLFEFMLPNWYARIDMHVTMAILERIMQTVLSNTTDWEVLHKYIHWELQCTKTLGIRPKSHHTVSFHKHNLRSKTDDDCLWRL